MSVLTCYLHVMLWWMMLRKQPANFMQIGWCLYEFQATLIPYYVELSNFSPDVTSVVGNALQSNTLEYSNYFFHVT